MISAHVGTDGERADVLAALLEMPGGGTPFQVILNGRPAHVFAEGRDGQDSAAIENTRIPDGAIMVPGWLPEPDPAQPHVVPVSACDELAWMLGGLGGSSQLTGMVLALSSRIHHELGGGPERPAAAVTVGMMLAVMDASGTWHQSRVSYIEPLRVLLTPEPGPEGR